MHVTKLRKIALMLVMMTSVTLYQNCMSFEAADLTGGMSQLSSTAPPSGGSNTLSQPHPRLFVDSVRVAQIKANLASDTILQNYLTKLTALADKYAAGSPPLYFIPDGATVGVFILPETAGAVTYGFSGYIVKDSSGTPVSPKSGYYQITDGQTVENFLRDVGTAMQFLEAAYLFTGNTTYSDAVNKWALAVTSYNQWDERFTLSTGEVTPYQADASVYKMTGVPLLSTASLLTSLAMAYDWCNAVLPPATLTRIEESLTYHANLVLLTAGAPVTGELNSGTAWWRMNYMQNHNEVGFAGLAVAASAMMPKDPVSATKWLLLAQTDFQAFKAILSADGATPEGVSYGSYMMGSTIDAASVFKTENNYNLFLDADGALNPFWQNAGDYLIYHISPKIGWTTNHALFGMNDVDTWAWYGPNTIFRKLATISRNPYWQDFATQLDAVAAANSASTGWETLTDYDPTLKGIDYKTSPNLPLFKNFATYGEAVSRSDWTSPNGSVVLYRSGPINGSQIPYAIRGQAPYGSGHLSPTAGSFAIQSNGLEMLRTSGYVVAKWTKSNNTLLFKCASGQTGCNPDGQIGQLGESNSAGGMLQALTILSPKQICEYDPDSYWKSLVAANAGGALTLPAQEPSPLSGVCSLAALTSQVPALCAKDSASFGLCQKIPTLTPVEKTSAWTIPTDEAGGVDYVIADATAAYDPVATSLQSYRRHLIYLRNHNVVLMINDIQLSASKTMNMLLHTSYAPTVSSSSGGTSVISASGGNTSFKISIFDPAATVSTAPLNVGGEIYTLQTVTLTSTGSSWSNAGAFAWAPPTTGSTVYQTPEAVSLQRIAASGTSGEIFRFTLVSATGTQTVVDVNPTAESVQIH